MRRYPQVGFSVARRMISDRISGSTGGRPRFLAAGWVQCRATRRRCQPITVAGLTIRNTWASRRRSSALASIARSIRTFRCSGDSLRWNRGSVGAPGIDQIDAGVFEVLRVSGGEQAVVRAADRGNLRIEAIDRQSETISGIDDA